MIVEFLAVMTYEHGDQPYRTRNHFLAVVDVSDTSDRVAYLFSFIRNTLLVSGIYTRVELSPCWKKERENKIPEMLTSLIANIS